MKKILLLILITNQLLLSQNKSDIKSYLPQISESYLHLHRNPELSFKEIETSKYLSKIMKSFGFSVTETVGGTGIVAILKNGNGKKVLMRTDMDALPIDEKTGSVYKSNVKQIDIDGIERPVMHACGHDIHMSVWLGTAKYLANHKDEWNGTLMMIAQPAEERGGGAKAMIEDGLYSKFFVPDYAIALHVNSNLPVGNIGYKTGFSMANVDMAEITIIGKGGHGAYPHKTIDPIVMASQLVLDLQTIVSREISPIDPAVVTVGVFQGGTKGNIIPTKVKLALTIRSYKDDVRNHLIEAIKRKTKAIAISYGVKEKDFPIFKLRDTYTPALYNNPEFTNLIIKGFENYFGNDNINEVSAVMGGEDFSRYGKTKESVPIFMFSLGVVNKTLFEQYSREGKKLPSIHSDKFLPDYEPSIEMGIKAMTNAIINISSN